MNAMILRLLGASAAVSLALCAQSPALARGSAADAAPLITPAGVTAQPLGKGQGYDLSKTTASYEQRGKIAFADLRGLTLYTWAKDPVGKSLCLGECAKMFVPFTAPRSAKPVAGWSVVKRSDGSRQWAYQGKPLYTYVKDVDPGAVGGDSPANYGGLRRNGLGTWVGGGYRGSLRGKAADIAPLPEGWAPALLFPLGDLQAPPGIAVREVAEAAAFALVDVRGHTLYVQSSKATCNDPVCAAFEPLVPPSLAQPIGDFTIVQGADGTGQWAYKGQKLFTYPGDLAPSYANGDGIDARFAVAAVKRYYMPDGARLVTTAGRGKVLATRDGQTLYRRDGFIFQSGGGHGLRRGQPPRPAVGRDLGTDPRCTDCLAHWHPYLAPADAQPQGFWDIATRADGKKQWVYQGYALWTFDGDKKPGDINGNDTYEIVVRDDPKASADVGTPMDGIASLLWAAAIP
jgi:predicted lipoprotein with Yx(FWY)xxD motif